MDLKDLMDIKKEYFKQYSKALANLHSKPPSGYLSLIYTNEILFEFSFLNKTNNDKLLSQVRLKIFGLPYEKYCCIKLKQSYYTTTQLV